MAPFYSASSDEACALVQRQGIRDFKSRRAEEREERESSKEKMAGSSRGFGCQTRRRGGFFLQESPGVIKFLGVNVVSNWIKEQVKGGKGLDRVNV